jgi:hypothetical protein
VSLDGGHRGNIPHDYVANVTFIDDGKGTKRIEVASLYATWPTLEEERTQRALQETFAWSEQEKRFILLSKHEKRYEKKQICHFTSEVGRDDSARCYTLQPPQIPAHQ